MSTTFEVIGVKSAQVTFKEVLELSQKKINSFLLNIGIEKSITLNVNLHEKQEKFIQDIDLSSEFKWKENEYVWFNVRGIGGGTDAYCYPLEENSFDPENPWWQLEEIELNNTTIENFSIKLEKAKIINQIWSFRRSAGQPAIINLAYGLIASSIAELTDGIIWSDDNAWNFERFPAEYHDFDRWYFNPDLETNENHSTWARNCINHLPKELERCY